MVRISYEKSGKAASSRVSADPDITRESLDITRILPDLTGMIPDLIGIEKEG